MASLSFASCIIAWMRPAICNVAGRTPLDLAAGSEVTMEVQEVQPSSCGRWGKDTGATYVLLCMLAVVTAFRISIADYSLWYDEIASLEFASQPISRLWSTWMLRETNPPLFYTVLSGWVTLVGRGEVAIRLLPIAIGTAGIWAAFVLGRATCDARVGLLAAALLSLSALHTDISHQVRAYNLAHTAVLFACIGMVKYLSRRSNGGLLIYAVGTLVALYSHTTLALFAVLAAAIVLWLLRSDVRAQVSWVAVNGVVLALWGWWVIMSVRQMRLPVTNIAWIAVPSLTDAIAMTAQIYLPFYLRTSGIVSTALICGLFLGLAICAVRGRSPVVTLLALLTLGAPVLLFMISQRVPIFLPRTLSWASGPELVLVAFAISRIPSPLIARTSVAVLLCSSTMGLAYWIPDREREPWRHAVALLERRPSSIVFVGDDAVALAVARYRTRLDAPMPIVVQSPYQERWATGLYHGPHLSNRAALDLIRTGRCATVVEWGPFHPPILDDPSLTVTPLIRHSAPNVAIIQSVGAARPCHG